MSFERKLSRRNLLKAAAVGGSALLLKGTASADGLSTQVRPYVLPTVRGVHIQALLTTGDSADNGYRMVGIPDGLGALDAGGTFQVFMNHELTGGDAPGTSGPGIVRAHGSDGSFVSKWTIDAVSLRVLKGEDLTSSPTQIYQWSSGINRYVNGMTWQWQRLCSADLPVESALQYGSLGTPERIFLNGEEISAVPSATQPRGR